MGERLKQLQEKHLFKDIKEQLTNRGVDRREFLKFCTLITATAGLPFGMVEKVAAAVESPQRPPVIWLHFQECTGCTESLLRATHPTVEGLVLDTISLDYSETLLAAAGHQAEKAMWDSIEANKGKFILVVEGSIPAKDGGIYCKVAGKTPQETLREVAPHAAAAIAIGSCASWGGVQSSGINPTGATGLKEILDMEKIDLPVINLPGCPASPYNLLSTVLYYLTLKKLPELDDKNRPLFAYGRLIHDNCERRPHFDAGRFAHQFGDENHRQGYCLYKLGCKGPETWANCPSILYCDVGSGSWPVGTGHPCFGCSEEGVGFTKAIHEQAEVLSVTPSEGVPGIIEDRGAGMTGTAAAVAGTVVGAIVGAGAVLSRKVKDMPEEDMEG